MLAAFCRSARQNNPAKHDPVLANTYCKRHVMDNLLLPEHFFSSDLFYMNDANLDRCMS